MDLKALILLAVCLTGLSEAMTAKVKHPTKKQNDKQHQQLQQQQIQFKQQTLQQLHQQNQRLNNHKKGQKQDQYAQQSSTRESKTPLGRPQLPLPLVLSPDNLHSMDFNPAISIALPPKDLFAKPKSDKGQKSSSDLQRRQVQQYDAAIAQLLEEALRTAAGNNDVASSASHIPQQPAAPVYHSAPVQQHVAFLPKAQPLADIQATKFVTGLTEAIVKPAPVLLKKGHDDENEHDHENYASKYQFGYRVVDTHSGNDFGQTESRDGALTTGHYHVLLPDGRLQTVRYWSDPTGFHAHISYDRHAVHP